MRPDAATIARMLGGKQRGHGWLCHCPCHDDEHPSLSIRQIDKTVLFHCFAGCSFEEITGALRSRGLYGQTGGSRNRHLAMHRRPQMETVEREEDAEAEGEALELWLRAKPLAGTLAERYLREHRRISVPLSPRALKFLPRAHARWAVPALIAAIEGIDGRLTAVVCTYLDPDTGRKADVRAPRKVFGRLRSGAVRLHMPDGNGRLGLAEGIETALSAFELTGIPCWAVIGVRLGRIALPPMCAKCTSFRTTIWQGKVRQQRRPTSTSPKVSKFLHTAPQTRNSAISTTCCEPNQSGGSTHERPHKAETSDDQQ